MQIEAFGAFLRVRHHLLDSLGDLVGLLFRTEGRLLLIVCQFHDACEGLVVIIDVLWLLYEILDNKFLDDVGVAPENLEIVDLFVLEDLKAQLFDGLERHEQEVPDLWLDLGALLEDVHEEGLGIIALVKVMGLSLHGYDHDQKQLVLYHLELLERLLAHDLLGSLLSAIQVFDALQELGQFDGALEHSHLHSVLLHASQQSLQVLTSICQILHGLRIDLLQLSHNVGKLFLHELVGDLLIDRLIFLFKVDKALQHSNGVRGIVVVDDHIVDGLEDLVRHHIVESLAHNAGGEGVVPQGNRLPDVPLVEQLARLLLVFLDEIEARHLDH